MMLTSMYSQIRLRVALSVKTGGIVPMGMDVLFSG